MGRTRSPFSQVIEQGRRAGTPFTRALRKADQAAFDQPFDCAKLHVQAGVYLSRSSPFEVITMAMLLERQTFFERLLAQLGRAEVKLSGGTEDPLGPGVPPDFPCGSRATLCGGRDADA